MKDNAELFRTVDDIISYLKLSGRNDNAVRLEESLSVSTVPGEILGEIRLTILEISQERFNDQKIEQKVTSALEYLNDILG